MIDKTKRAKQFWKRVVFLLIMEIFFFYAVQLIVPSCNLLLENTTHGYVAYVNEKTGYKALPVSNNGWIHVESELYGLKEDLSLDIDREQGRASVPVRVINLAKAQPNSYNDMYGIIIYNRIPLQFALFLVFNGVFFVGCSILRTNEDIKSNWKECYIYRSAQQQPWNIKKWVLFWAVVLASYIIPFGSDVVNIAGAMSQAISGIDIYQIQNLREVEVHLLEFNTFPYNPIMLLFYLIPSLLSFSYAPFYIHAFGDLTSSLILKACSALLLRETALSIQGYMLDRGMTTIRRGAVIQTILTPAVFYIAIIFVQLDALPMYLVSEGILQQLREDGNRLNKTVGSVLMAMGCFCKMQNLMMVPTCLLIYFALIYKKERVLKELAIYIAGLMANVVVIYFTNPIIKQFLSKNLQSKRIFYTVIQYAQGLYFLVSIFTVVLVFSLVATRIRCSLKHCQLLFITYLLNAMLFLGLSASIIATSSVYIMTFPAFAYILFKEKDGMRRFILMAFSFLIVTEIAFTSMGDITGILKYFGSRGFFTNLSANLIGTEEGIFLTSIIMTISKAGLVLYLLLFFEEVKRLCAATEDKQ